MVTQSQSFWKIFKQLDDLRDKPNERKEIFEYFKKTLEKHNKIYKLINGTFSERKLKSIEIIDKLINIVT